MLQRIRFVEQLPRTFACVGIAVLLSGCGSVKLPSLSTGSLGSSQQNAAAPAAPAVKPDDPIERAVQVGVTMAQAQKCGYFFDPVQLKANYLAAEAVRYPAPDTQQKVANALEFGRIRVSRQIAKSEGFCTKDRTSSIKGKLTRYLAGDFTAEALKKPVETGGLFGGLDAEVEKKAPTREEIFDPALIE